MRAVTETYPIHFFAPSSLYATVLPATVLLPSSYVSRYYACLGDIKKNTACYSVDAFAKMYGFDDVSVNGML